MSATPDDDDPWAPLPPDQLWQRPGEDHLFGKRPDRVSSRGKPRPEDAAAAAPPPMDGSPPPPNAPVPVVPPRAAKSPKQAPLRPPPPLDPAAAQALAALQQKLAATPSGQSLVSEAQRRDQRVARHKRAVHGPLAPELAAQHVRGRDPEAEPVLEYAIGADGRDAREDEEWFAKLPPAEQERLRSLWAQQRLRGVGRARDQRRRGDRRFVAGVACALATVFTGTGHQWYVTLGAGVITGLWWRNRPADRFLDPVRALACLVATNAAAMLQTGEMHPAWWMDAMLTVCFAALVGFDGEIKRSGGFD